jgi:hypothetical protein
VSVSNRSRIQIFLSIITDADLATILNPIGSRSAVNTGMTSNHYGVTHTEQTWAHCALGQLFVDLDSLNPDPDPAFQVNPDPFPVGKRIHFQAFDDPELKKLQLNFFINQILQKGLHKL